MAKITMMSGIASLTKINPSLIKEGFFVFLLSTFYFQLKISDFACIYQKKVVILHAKLI